MKNSADVNIIEHDGIVQKNDNESVSILILSESACSGCHAGNSCSMADRKEKIVEVKGTFGVKEGDHVIVTMEQSSGYRALFLGYIFPLIALLTALIAFVSAGLGEIASGIGALAILVPYYFILFLLRDRINEKFKFSIKA